MTEDTRPPISDEEVLALGGSLTKATMKYWIKKGKYFTHPDLLALCIDDLTVDIFQVINGWEHLDEQKWNLKIKNTAIIDELKDVGFNVYRMCPVLLILVARRLVNIESEVDGVINPVLRYRDPDTQYTVAHAMAHCGFNFENPEVLELYDSNVDTVAHVYARQGGVITDSRILALANEAGESVQDVMDTYIPTC